MPSLNERFTFAMHGCHNDKIQDPITIKRAPINSEIIEELEQIRINFKGKKDDMLALQAGKAIDYIKNMNIPIFDLSQLDTITNISEDVKLKV